MEELTNKSPEELEKEQRVNSAYERAIALRSPNNLEIDPVDPNQYLPPIEPSTAAERRKARRERHTPMVEDKASQRASRRAKRQEALGLTKESKAERRRLRREGYEVDSRPVSELPDEMLFKPQSFKEYQEIQQGKDKELDLMGAKEHSLVSRGFRAIKGMMDEDYVSEYSIEGKMKAMEDITKRINELGAIASHDVLGVAEAKQLWNKKHELQYDMQLEMLVENSDMDIKQVYEAVVENPEDFLMGMAQEVINMPELIFVPSVLAARTGVIATKSAMALGAGTKATQVAQVAGGLTGAASGGLTLGTIDRLSSQLDKGQELDYFKAVEQSKVDAVLGMGFYGAGRVLTKGVSNYRDHLTTQRNKSMIENNSRQNEAESSVKLQNQKAQKNLEALEDNPLVETFSDVNGNVYQFEIKEVVDLTKEIKDLKAMKTKYKGDTDAVEAIDMEIKANKQKLAEGKTLNANDIQEQIKELGDLKAAKRAERNSIAGELFNKESRTPAIPNEFMKVTDADGIEHTLRKVTPKALEDGQVMINGITSINQIGVDVHKSNNDMLNYVRNTLESPLVSLKNIAKDSPTAKLLLDRLSPRSDAYQGRHNIETLTESTNYMQAQYLNRSDLIKQTLKDSGDYKELEAELRGHMRKTLVSENPIILKASEDYRKLLDDVNVYAKGKGQKVQTTPDFLPRYYNREVFKDNNSRVEFSKIVNEQETKKVYDDILNSAGKIAANVTDSDEIGRVTKGTKRVKPIGFRKYNKTTDASIDKFLDPEFIGSIDRYLANAIKRTEVDSTFGEFNNMVKQIGKELRESGENVAGKYERELKDWEVGNLDHLRELAHGTYGTTGGDVSKALTDTALTINTIGKLTLSTITSITEPMTMLFRLNESNGVVDVIKAYTNAGNIKRLWGDTSFADRKKEAHWMGLTHDANMKERMDAMVGEGLEGWPAKISNGFLKGVMLHQWTEYTRSIAYEAAHRDTLKTIKNLSRGRDTELRKGWLADNGIDHVEAIKWFNEGGKAEGPVYESIKKGAVRQARTMIADPDKFNKAKVLSSAHPAWRLFGQYKSFGSTFTNTVMKETYDDVVKLWNRGHKGKALKKATTAFSLITGMGFWATYKSDLLFKDELRDDDVTVAAKIMSGLTSMAVPGAAMMTSPMNSYSAAGAIAGPTGSDLEQIYRTGNPLAPIVNSPTGKLVQKGIELIE